MPRSSIKKRPAHAAALLKHMLAIIAVLIVAGCSGGGCGGGGCSSCGGVTALPDGFDPNHRIENAGSVRLTQSGLGFLQSNLGTLAQSLLGGMGNGGVITFNVPEASGGTTCFDYTVCKGGGSPGQCTAEINIGGANLNIAPTSPYDLRITGTVPIRVKDLPISYHAVCIGGSVSGTLTGNNGCPSSNQTYDDFPLDVDIQIHIDPSPNHTARFGYSQLTVKQVVDKTAADNNLSDHLHFCGGLDAGILNGVSGLIVGQLSSALIGTLSSQINDQLCQKESATQPCPTGTTPDGSGICRYNGDPGNPCASIILGTDGHMDLGGLLASISPGTKGGLDFLFAAGGANKNTSPQVPAGANLAWGDLAPINGGGTLGMFGGAEPNPISKCVKLSEMAPPTGIPIPEELFNNTVPDWPSGTPGPHVGIALSERFANYALNGIYNSGLLCIGISTENIPLLSSGTLGLLAPSAKDLGLQHDPQQVALVIRPGAPPQVTFGNGTDLATDPLLRVQMNQASIDFYFWSLDRFIRFMTATFDLDVPVNLSVGPDGLTPVIDKIGVNNGKVTNSGLLREKPDQLADSLGSLIGGLVGQQLGGALKPIDLNASLASLGLELVIPDTVDGQGSPGLRKLTSGSDNFLGIFAALGLPQGATPSPGVDPQAAVATAHTEVQVTKKMVDPAGLKFKTLRADNGPVVELLADSSVDDGTRPVEFAYKVDDGVWHPWTRSRFLTVRDDWMRVQGRHTIYVRSRIAGEPKSVDREPAQAEVVIDADPPAIEVTQDEDGKVTIAATDHVTPDTLVRFRLDDGAWSAWTLASRLAAVDVGYATEISVEAKDAEGNLGTAQQSLIRGRADAGAAAGCGCTVAGDERASGHGLWLLGIAVAGIGARLLRRRRTPSEPKKSAPSVRRAARRTLGGLAAIAVASSWAGCNCGDNSQTASTTGGTTTTTGTGGEGGGNYTCTGQCFSLQPGLIGEYASFAPSGSDIWVAGYAEADWDNGYQYGDLVVGKWDGSKVDWTAIDGVPSDPPVDGTQYDLKGFRGGQTEAGDDVGLWTSIAVGGDGNPAIAYYDRTHKALKFAKFDGTKWSSHTVQTKPSSDIGRYAKLLFVGGSFVITYQAIEPGGDDGALMSAVRVATSAAPAEGAWKFEDAAVAKNTPCRAAFCASGKACLKSSQTCVNTSPSSSCTPACASGTACIDQGAGPSCMDIIDNSKLDSYPDAIGGYIAAAPDGKGGFGIAYYDRTKGNLMTVRKAGGAWSTLVVDGQDANGNDTGDVGIGASLVIDDSGDWHITYVNGFSEAVQYVKLTGGTTVNPPETVDDGLGIGTTPFDDGQHLVGDDSHVMVLAGGEVHVTYQDATAGTLHYAVGAPGGGAHTWTVKSISQDGFAGAFSGVFSAGGKLKIANWWRVGGASVKGDVRILDPK